MIIIRERIIIQQYELLSVQIKSLIDLNHMTREINEIINLTHKFKLIAIRFSIVLKRRKIVNIGLFFI